MDVVLYQDIVYRPVRYGRDIIITSGMLMLEIWNIFKPYGILVNYSDFDDYEI